VLLLTKIINELRSILRHSICLFLLSVICTLGYAQESEKKIRKSISSYTQSRLDESNNLLNNARETFGVEPEKALDMVHDALLINIEENHLKEEADAYKLLGDFNFQLGEYNLSLKNYEKAKVIYENLGLGRKRKVSFENGLYELNYNAGRASEKLGDPNKASAYYSIYLKSAESKKDKDAIVKARIGLGNIFKNDSLYSQAEDEYKKALAIETKRNNKNGIATINLLLGELDAVRNNQQQAIEHFRISQNNAYQLEDDSLVNVAYSNMSNVYKTNNNIDEDLKLNQEALGYNQERDNVGEVIQQNIGIADLLLKKEDKEEEAIERLNSSIKISEETGDLRNKSRAVEVLSKAYKQQGDEEKFKQNLREYENLRDSIRKIEENAAMDASRKGEILENAQNKLTILEKDKELSERTIELLRKERIIQEDTMKRQKIFNYFLLSGLLVLLVTSYLVFKSNREKNRANQLLALKSLRGQMNPHFIFNALNSVNSFISNNDEKSANRYLSEFSKLMREVMENSQEDFIPLSKEINILELYLKLEHDRFKDKFDYEFNVDKTINIEETSIPPMLVQPYIENAVWHGLRYKEEKGFLAVSMTNEGNAIVIEIKDDGIGRAKSKELKTKNQKVLKSTGIKNIDSRLKIIRDIYKTNLDIQIEDLDVKAKSGTKVTIKLMQQNTLSPE